MWYSSFWSTNPLEHFSLTFCSQRPLLTASHGSLEINWQHQGPRLVFHVAASRYTWFRLPIHLSQSKIWDLSCLVKLFRWRIPLNSIHLELSFHDDDHHQDYIRISQSTTIVNHNCLSHCKGSAHAVFGSLGEVTTRPRNSQTSGARTTILHIKTPKHLLHNIRLKKIIWSRKFLNFYWNRELWFTSEWCQYENCDNGTWKS